MLHNRATDIMADELRSSQTTAIAALVARYGLVIVLAWFGAMKFTSYESHGISHWVANSPLLSWAVQHHVHRRLWSIERINRIDCCSTAGG